MAEGEREPAAPPKDTFDAFVEELDAIYGELESPAAGAGVSGVAECGSSDADAWPFAPPARGVDAAGDGGAGPVEERGVPSAASRAAARSPGEAPDEAGCAADCPPESRTPAGTGGGEPPRADSEEAGEAAAKSASRWLSMRKAGAVRSLASGLLSHASHARKVLVEEAKELALEACELAGELRQGAEITAQETAEMREQLATKARQRAATAAKTRDQLMTSARESTAGGWIGGAGLMRGKGADMDGAKADAAEDLSNDASAEPASEASTNQAIREALGRRARGLRSGWQQVRQRMPRSKAEDPHDEEDRASNFTIGSDDEDVEDLDSCDLDSGDEQGVQTTAGSASPDEAASDATDPISEFRGLGKDFAAGDSP